MYHKVAFSFADGKTLFFPVNGNEILLDAALRNGINIPLDCREGVCGTCMGRCESGDFTMDYADDETLSAEDLVQRKMLTCQTRVTSDASFYFDFASTICGASQTSQVRGFVSHVEEVSPTTAILHIDAGSAGRQLDFLPGQYARVSVPGTEAKRSYSFANRPNAENKLQFLIRLLPDGMMSNYIRDHAKIGDEIHFEAPLGAFYMRHIEKPLVLVAGGTGLSAFLGMLDEISANGGCGQPVHLFYGVRQTADLCELERIRGYTETIENFTFTPVISDEGQQWNGKRGFVPEHFDADAMRETSFDMYLCGPPPMVESVKTWLTANDIQSGKLYFEKFTESNS